MLYLLEALGCFAPIYLTLFLCTNWVPACCEKSVRHSRDNTSVYFVRSIVVLLAEKAETRLERYLRVIGVSAVVFRRELQKWKNQFRTTITHKLI